MRTLSAISITASMILALFAGSAQAQSLSINNHGGPTLTVSGGSLSFLGVSSMVYSGNWDYTWTLLKNGSEITRKTQSIDCTLPLCELPTFQYQTPASCMTGTYKLQLKASRYLGLQTSQTESNSITVSAPGSPTPVLKVNGKSGLNIDVCAAGPITVDASQSTCTSGYFLGMALSDIHWNTLSTPSMRWLTATELGAYGPISNFNAKRFYEDQYFTFVPGQYYRLTLATSPWVDTTTLLRIVGSTASLTINGSQASPTLVNAAGPIRLDGSQSTCASGYFVSVQLSDPSWHRFGTEVMRWLTADDLVRYGPINNFDVKKFAEDQSLPIVAGQYYRVKLAVGTPWSESTVLIRATTWTPWLDADAPGGVGDYELLSNFIAAGQACSHPIEIECQTTSGVDWRAAGQVYTCDANRGGFCVNDHQGPNGLCLDYRVRFRC